jgi:hypothetical protein
MKDLLDRTIALIPHYITDITDLISGPKCFLLQRTENGASHLADSLLFLALSFVISWFLDLSFLDRDPFIQIGEDLSFFAFGVMAFGAALCLAWRLVKGRAEIKVLFVIHFYYAGVLWLMMALSAMAALGVLRATDAQLYEDYREAVAQGQILHFGLNNYERLHKSNAYMPVLVVSHLVVLMPLIWTISVWGAYRVANHLSKFRSAVAFMLFMLFGIPIMASVAFVANAVVG